MLLAQKKKFEITLKKQEAEEKQRIPKLKQKPEIIAYMKKKRKKRKQLVKREKQTTAEKKKRKQAVIADWHEKLEKMRTEDGSNIPEASQPRQNKVINRAERKWRGVAPKSPAVELKPDAVGKRPRRKARKFRRKGR